MEIYDINFDEENRNSNRYELIIPTAFEDCLSPQQQIIWLFIHKQTLLTAGDNITLQPLSDGTVKISATGGGGDSHEYQIVQVEHPQAGNIAEYYLKDMETGQYSGDIIEIPEGTQGRDGVGISDISYKETDAQGNYVYTVTMTDSTTYDIVTPRGPQGQQGVQGPQGPQGQAGQDGTDGTDGTDGVGIVSITYKETDAQGNYVYTVLLSDNTTYDMTSPRGPQGQAGQNGEGVPSGGSAGQVLSKASGTDYDTEWVTPSSGGMATDGSNADSLVRFANAFSVGTRVGNTGSNSVTMGVSARAEGVGSFAQGDSVIALGRASHASGYGVTAQQDYSFVHGILYHKFAYKPQVFTISSSVIDMCEGGMLQLNSQSQNIYLEDKDERSSVSKAIFLIFAIGAGNSTTGLYIVHTGNTSAYRIQAIKSADGVTIANYSGYDPITLITRLGVAITTTRNIVFMFMRLY